MKRIPHDRATRDLEIIVMHSDDDSALRAADRLAEYIKQQRRLMDLVGHLERQRKFSEATFGPGPRTAGVIDHIKKELEEIESDPLDLEEWVDVTLLALDGAWRTGASPQKIAAAINAKMAKNESRDWPDWRKVGQDKAIEHVRDPEKQEDEDEG